MSGNRHNDRSDYRLRVAATGLVTASRVVGPVLIFIVFFCLPEARGARLEPSPQGVGRSNNPVTDIENEDDGDGGGQPVGGLCNPANICSDPDCSPAAKCTAGCFGNPTCAAQCGGNRCNVGCNPGVCGSNCPQECNVVTCPQNTCSPNCGDPNCKVACGGSPCNGGCPNRCDPLLCPDNALCLSSCGGDSCNVGCSPCAAGCPQECSPVVCPANAICLTSCGGDPCNVSCNPGVCGSGCPLECDPVLCPENVLGCILDLLNDVSNRVDTTINRATEARDVATEARDQGVEVVSNMNDGLQHLTGEMRARIEDAVAALQQAVLDELAGATNFTNGPNSCSAECESFRSALILLLTSIQEISNTFLSDAGLGGQADFSAEMDFIEALSGKALYPLYRVLLTLPVLDDDFLLSMSEVADQLIEVAPYINDAVQVVGAIDVCRTLADNDVLVERLISVAKNIDKVGKGATLAGSVLKSVGKTKIAARVGLWGWAGINYTGGLLERFGGHLKSLGQRLTPIADKLERKLQYCVLKVNGDDVIDAVEVNHQEFMLTDQAILNMLNAIPHGHSADLNDDQLVDLLDYLEFQAAFTGPGAQNPQRESSSRGD